MSGAAPDETEIANRLWPDLPSHPEIGRYGTTGVAWVREGDFRRHGASGGMLSWIASEMLAQGMIEEVIHVSPAAPGGDARMLFSYSISRNLEDIKKRAKSRYYPVHARDAFRHMQKSDKKTLYIGLPCFVKAARILAEADPAIGRNLRYTLGLVCGHLKSSGFAEMLAWQVGVPPDELLTVDFRVKLEGKPASHYGFSATRCPENGQAGEKAMKPMAALVGRDWGQGMMRYKACDYCDDVLAECADIAVGDAWISPWSDEWQGTNVFVARNAEIISLLETARAAGRLHIEDIPPDRAADSQRGGLSHRREGLRWRLWKAQKAGQWVPKKRFTPTRALTTQRERIYDLREKIRDQSHAAFLMAKAAGRFELFNEEMAPLLALYAAANRRPNLIRRKLSGLKRRLRKLTQKPLPSPGQ